MKQKLSADVVSMYVMKWSKEMPPSDGPGNNISVDNIKSEKPSTEIKTCTGAVGTPRRIKLIIF